MTDINWRPHIRSRLASLRLSPSRENEIVEELAQHLDDRRRELVAGGASEEEATKVALGGFREGDRRSAARDPAAGAEPAGVGHRDDDQDHRDVALPGADGGVAARGVRRPCCAARRVGIYGVLSFTIARRSREMGIRLALGAASREMFLLVVRDGMTLVCVGAVIGLTGGFVAARSLARFLYGVPTSDPATFTAAAILLIAVALVACIVPARRAMRVNPLTALRFE